MFPNFHCVCACLCAFECVCVSICTSVSFPAHPSLHADWPVHSRQCPAPTATIELPNQPKGVPILVNCPTFRATETHNDTTRSAM
jgi:hypothetical protein